MLKHFPCIHNLHKELIYITLLTKSDISPISSPDQISIGNWLFTSPDQKFTYKCYIFRFAYRCYNIKSVYSCVTSENPVSDFIYRINRMFYYLEGSKPARKTNRSSFPLTRTAPHPKLLKCSRIFKLLLALTA